MCFLTQYHPHEHNNTDAHIKQHTNTHQMS